MNSVLVQVEGATKRYLLGKTVVPALKGVDVRVQPGEFLAIAGPSGSGKTTLLNLIGCIEQPTSGRVWIEGAKIESLSSDALAELRLHRIGFVFQRFNLLPVLTALENVEYPLLIAKRSARDARWQALRALEHVGLAGMTHHKPLELSGGQQQRVAIARAIVTDVRLVLADEPTANLDQATGQAIVELMREINRTQQTTFIFSTHDPKIMDKASRLIRLRDGVIEPD